MTIFAAAPALFFICIVLIDAFESIVLPRRVMRRVRLTRYFYQHTWRPFASLARRIKSAKRRESVLSYYGPLSLILLLCLWAFLLILSFALLQWSLVEQLNTPDKSSPFTTYLYMSGVIFFTLGFGDVTPIDASGRFIAVIEAGMGFGFLAIVIGYLPVIYQSYSQREVNISLLDARAGTPPTATELLRRHCKNELMDELATLLRDWERWCAELMESHLSYPVLSYFRSQHDNQSWLAALTAILDTSALVIVGIEGSPRRQAQLTFAIARHAVVDLSQVYGLPPRPPASDRLPSSDLARMRDYLTAAEVPLRDGPDSVEKLTELRLMYEPYVNALAAHLLTPLPPWVMAAAVIDNWQTSAWARISARGARSSRIGEVTNQKTRVYEERGIHATGSDDHF